MKYPRAAWAVGANLEAVKNLKTMHLMYMSEEDYQNKIKALEDEYREACKIAESHYP